MGDDHPKLLEDRDVLVLRGDERRQARLRGWLDGYDGPRPLYRIELFLGVERYTASALDMFTALVRLRLQLEPDGWMIALQGARRDTYPSRMSTDMAGGRKIYVLRPGQKATGENVVDTLADAPVERLGTVAEQRAAVEARLAADIEQYERPPS